MKKRIPKTVLAVTGSLAMTLFLTLPLQAQEGIDKDRRAHFEERRAKMHERRGKFLENNPEAAARAEETLQRYAEMRENNPEAAARMREQRRERFRNGRPGRRDWGEDGGFGPPPGETAPE